MKYIQTYEKNIKKFKKIKFSNEDNKIVALNGYTSSNISI